MLENAPQKLIVLGARSQAPVLADWVDELPGYEITHFVENQDRTRCGGAILGRPIIWVDEVRSMVKSHSGFAAFGSPERDGLVKAVAAFGLSFATPVHPSSVLSQSCTLGEGSIVSPAVVISAFTSIGRHVLVNRGALIGHNVTVGDYGTIGPGSNIAGFCEIGPKTYIGMGATILDQVKVGANCVIGAGSVVTRDVPDGQTAYGVPARIVSASNT
ncbi:MAG: NeuD/PglB/VioB family sugar acetyltransferase [Pseudomonadota bacterium]